MTKDRNMGTYKFNDYNEDWHDSKSIMMVFVEMDHQYNLVYSTKTEDTSVVVRNLKTYMYDAGLEVEDAVPFIMTTDIARDILKQNTLDFSENNRKSINELVNPLKEKIETFQKTVSDTYEKGLKERSGLKVEIEKLVELNQKISEEANNLTRALKSDSKKQGNWGEMVLERLLERSGLIKGEEYVIQESYRNDKNELIRPDVVIKLPEEKYVRGPDE